jgi:hypothetical protein
MLCFHEPAQPIPGAEMALAKRGVGDSALCGDLVEGAAFELGEGEKVGFVGAEGAGADGFSEDVVGVVPGFGGLGVGGAGVLPGGVEGFAVGGGW